MAKRNYIDKKEMYDEVMKSQKEGKVTERLGEMFMLLAEGVYRMPSFRRYEQRYGKAFKEDMLSLGVERCLESIDKFDGERFDNPYSYYTSCIFRRFQGYLRMEYNQMNIKNKEKTFLGLNPDYGYIDTVKEQEKRDAEEDEANVDLYDEEYEELLAALEGDIDEELPSEEDFQFLDEDDTPPQKPPEKRKVDRMSPKGYVITNPHVEAMTLWDDEPEEPDNSFDPISIFGVKSDG